MERPIQGMDNQTDTSLLRTIDLFTETAAILNKLVLRSIMGCPGGMNTFRLVFTSAFWAIFLKVFLEEDCNGKKGSLCRVWM